MTIAKKVQYILDKYRDTKFNRAEFFWRYIAEFVVDWKENNHAIELPYITKKQFKEFWLSFPAAERTLRDQLKDRLPRELDQKRLALGENFRKEYKNETRNQR